MSMPTYSVRGFYLWIFLIAATGCGELNFDGETTRESTIVNGSIADPSKFPAVGKLLYKNEMWCTVFLVRPQVVATASHCLERGNNWGPIDPVDFTVRFESLGRSFDVVSFHRPLLRHYGVRYLADVAVMLLDKKVPVPPLRISNNEQPRGTKTTLVGYGQPSTNGKPGTLRYATAALDSPSVAAEKIRTQADSPSMVCFSDSGGPWLVGGKVVGITHGMFGYARDPCSPLAGTYSKASSMAKWGSWVAKSADRLQGQAVDMAANATQFSWFNDVNATVLFSPPLNTIDDLITKWHLEGDFNGDDCTDELTWYRTPLSKPDKVLVVHGCGEGSRAFEISKGLRMIHLFDADGKGGDDVMLQLSDRMTVLVPKSGEKKGWKGLPSSYRCAFADVDGQAGQEILLVDGSRIDVLNWRTKKHTTSYVSIPSAYSGINGTYDVDGNPGKELVLTVLGGIRIVSFRNGFKARAFSLPGASWAINGHEDLDGDGDDEIIIAQQGVVRIVDATTVTPFTMPTKHYIIYGTGQTDTLPGKEVVIRTAAGIRVLSYRQGKLTAVSKIPSFQNETLNPDPEKPDPDLALVPLFPPLLYLLL